MKASFREESVYMRSSR